MNLKEEKEYKKAIASFKNANSTLNLPLSPISLNVASNNKPKNKVKSISITVCSAFPITGVQSPPSEHRCGCLCQERGPP